MRIRPLVVLLALASLTLVGCAPGGTPESSSSPSPTVESPSPSPSPDPERLVVSVDAITHEHDGDEDVYALADGAGIVSLFAAVTGDAVAGEEFEGPYGSEGGMRYTWDGVILSVYGFDGSAYLTISAPTIGDVEMVTSDGLAVGGTRADAIAAGAIDLCPYDGDGDGSSDLLVVQTVEVPDTQSLCRVGSTGVLYLGIEFGGDTVTQLFTPGNDFSDI